MNKIISMTLYGNNPIYTNGSIENAKLIPKIFGTEWEIRFYTRDVAPSVIQELKDLNCTVIDMQNNDIKNGRLLRFLAITENNIVLVRDCDSIVSYREKMMVLEFLNSKKKLHIIRDHPNHKEYMMAGMFGFNNSGINMKSKIYESKIKDNPHYTMDQIFLAKCVYPLFKGNMLIHDNFNKFYKERDEIVLKYPRLLTHIGQRIIRSTSINETEDKIRLNEFKGFIKFEKINFESVNEFMDYFLNCLKISRILKRTLIINDYRIKNNIFKLENYILIDELLRYTNITSINILNTIDITISSKELEANEIKLSLLLKMDNLSKYELLNIDIDVIPDVEIDVDEFTLYNVIQLKDELNYGMEEYIIRKNIDLYTTVICHDNETYSKLETNKDANIVMIKYENLYADYSENKILNEFLRLFSGIFRVHIKPSVIVEKISIRYWNHLDGDFQKI